MLLSAVLALACVSLSGALRVLSAPPHSCSQQDLICTVSNGNCMDPEWRRSHKYTPTDPENLEVEVITRLDEAGQLHPVLDVKWNLKDDGSIQFLNATELNILVLSTNENRCVRYSFQNELPMRNQLNEKWSFSADMVVVNPGQSYHVSVSNIPKPELGHSTQDISVLVNVPPCRDPAMKMTQFCLDRGSLWHPNISVVKTTAVSGRSVLTVSFNPDLLCEEYTVIVTCDTNERHLDMYRGNQTTMNATFSLDHWHRSCCMFNAEIKPIFPKCGQDCTRRVKTLNICPSSPEDPAGSQYAFVIVGVLLLLLAIGTITWILCRMSGNPKGAPHVERENLVQPVNRTPKVLVIYSQDHLLYRDVVLKLCAFLQAECGIQVLMDQLDTTSVSMVGRLRWLEWQRQQLQNPCDKILVLCSRGVQAKWRAVCGRGRVMLREDVLSPTDDMLTPFLNLFLPDMHQAGMHGKYMVAYFEDICSESDVPSVFDIAVKYKLMKHFEELYFRILDVEKYQPDQVKQVERISGDEYFKCRLGRALKSAIETFQAYQLENPDWFEKECVTSEEEAVAEANLLIHELQAPSVLESLPLIRDGPPTFVNEVEITGNQSRVHVVTPEVNPVHQMSSIVELTPQVNSHFRPSYLLDVSSVPRYPPSQSSVCMVEPVLIKSPPLKQTYVAIVGDPVGQIPVELEEELLSMSHPASQNISMLRSPDGTPQSSVASTLKNYSARHSIGYAEPMQLDEEEVLELIGKHENSGSDQGYISKMSSQGEPALKEDPVMALARLQEELFQQNLMQC